MDGTQLHHAPPFLVGWRSYCTNCGVILLQPLSIKLSDDLLQAGEDSAPDGPSLIDAITQCRLCSGIGLEQPLVLVQQLARRRIRGRHSPQDNRSPHEIMGNGLLPCCPVETEFDKAEKLWIIRVDRAFHEGYRLRQGQGAILEPVDHLLDVLMEMSRLAKF